MPTTDQTQQQLDDAAHQELARATPQPFVGAVCSPHRSDKKHRCSGWMGAGAAAEKFGVRVAPSKPWEVDTDGLFDTEPAGTPPPDRYCVTTPDGGCVSTDPRDMHASAPAPTIHQHGSTLCSVNHDGDENEEVRCGTFGEQARCTLCNASRIDDATRPSGWAACGNLECKDPLYDVRVEDAQASGESASWADPAQDLLVGDAPVDATTQQRITAAQKLYDSCVSAAQDEVDRFKKRADKMHGLSDNDVKALLMLIAAADKARVLRDALVATTGG